MYVYDTATGAPLLLSVAVTCAIIHEDGARDAPVVATEDSNGWYYYDFTPDAAGTWATEWAAPAGNSVAYPYKEFHVGAGQEADIYTRLGAPAGASVSADVADIHADVDNVHTDVGTAITNIATADALHDVPAKDGVVNAHIRDVLGNKTDTPKWLFSDTQSAMSLLKAATHTAGGISYAGQCDAAMVASKTVIDCFQLAGFGDDFFNTDYVMKVALNDNSHGASPEADAARDITDYDSVLGRFTTDAFNQNVEANDKIVVSKRSFYNLDQIPIQTTPGTNSLAYRLSQYLASGDGDWATGTALPADTSLYDVLAGARGIPAFPDPAAPANDVSIAEVLHAVYDDTDAVQARTANHLVTRTWFSDQQASATVGAASANVALPSVVLPAITGTIVSVYAGFKFRMVENTGAANKLNGDQYIQTNNAAEGYDNAIKFVDDQYSIVASTKEGGDCIVGNINLQASAHPIDAFNVTVTFQWTAADADVANLVFYDVQTFLIVSYY